MSGAAFAVGNLLLARQMGTAEYASLSLAVAVFIVASQVATLGMSQVALRRFVRPDARLLLRLLAQGALGGAACAAVLSRWQDLAPAAALLLGVATAFGPLLWVAPAALLREGRKARAWCVQTVPDWVLLSLGIIALAAPRWADAWAFGAYCLAVSVLALAGWSALRRAPPGGKAPPEPGWRMLASATAIVAGSVLVIQFERLAVGFLLDARALAMFGVLASLALFPFRLVIAGASFVLVPGLQRLTDADARRRLVWRELKVILAALTATSALLCLVAPAIARWITAGRYAPGSWLVLAACLAGAAKVCHGLPRAIITACGNDRHLELLGRTVWAGIGLSLLGAVAGTAWGLAGVLYGVALGSITGALPAMRAAARLLAKAE